jgi:hypothetical protein
MTKLLALVAGLLLSLPALCCTIVQQTPDDAWSGEGDPSLLDFPGNVTAGNSVICIITGYNGSGYTFTSIDDENGTNVYSVVADSGTAAPFTRVVIAASHAVVGTFNGMEVNGHSGGNYGAFKCYELSGLAASPNDQMCGVQDVLPQAADANCAISTLSQAQEFVLAGMANADGTDNNQNITGPTGGPTWTNDDIFQDASARLGYSIDRGITAATTGFTVQYSHDNLADADHSIAVATFECASSGSYWWRRRRGN